MIFEVSQIEKRVSFHEGVNLIFSALLRCLQVISNLDC
jgi:hypothetical protein